MPQLSCRFLASVTGVNSFAYVSQALLTEGDTSSIYLQLIDLNLDGAACGFTPAGRRYCPLPGSTLRVTLRNLDSAVQTIKTAIQPFPGDASIWSLPVFPSDQLRGTVTLLLDLTEVGVHSYASVQPAISVRAKNG